MTENIHIYFFSTQDHFRNKGSCTHRRGQSLSRQSKAAAAIRRQTFRILNPLKPKDLYMRRTAPLTSRRCVLYIYSRNIRTEYFKHAALSPFFFSSKCRLFHNAVLFGSCIIRIFHTGCAKI